MTSQFVVIDNCVPPEEEVIAWFIPPRDEETKVVRRGRPRAARATEGVETK